MGLAELSLPRYRNRAAEVLRETGAFGLIQRLIHKAASPVVSRLIAPRTCRFVGIDFISGMLRDYDLRTLQRRLERRGFRCEIRDFPADYWSREFQTSRSNLLIFVGDGTRVAPHV